MKKNKLEILEMIKNKKTKNSVDELDSRMRLAVQEIIKLEELTKKFFPGTAQKDKEK